MITRGLYRQVRDYESVWLQKIGAPQDTNLVILVGSILQSDTDDKSKAINEVLCHELTHHAQYGTTAEEPKEISEEEQLAHAKLFLATRIFPVLRFIFASSIFLFASMLFFSFSLYATLGGLLTTNLLVHLSGRGRRRNKIKQLRKELFQLYRADSRESDAFKHAEHEMAIAKIEPRDTKLDPIYMNPDERITTIDRMSGTVRRSRALKPPGTLKRTY
jgi:hypothetical protein